MKRLIQRRKRLLGQLAQCGNMVRGSINWVCGRCNRANCRCEKKSVAKAYRLTYKDPRQNSKIVYVAQDRLPEMRRLLANYARLRKIIELLIAVNIEIFKAGVRR